MTFFRENLGRLGACREALDWVGERSLPEAWEHCDRGDWLLWLAERAGVDPRTVGLAACACARTALRYVPAGEECPRQAIDVTEAWCRGEASADDARAAYAVSPWLRVGIAAYASGAAVPPMWAALAARDAAYAAAYAAAACAADAAAAYAAQAAAYAGAYFCAAHTYGAAYDTDAKQRALRACADLVRGIIPLAVITDAWTRTTGDAL